MCGLGLGVEGWKENTLQRAELAWGGEARKNHPRREGTVTRAWLGTGRSLLRGGVLPVSLGCPGHKADGSSPPGLFHHPPRPYPRGRETSPPPPPQALPRLLSSTSWSYLTHLPRLCHSLSLTHSLFLLSLFLCPWAEREGQGLAQEAVWRPTGSNGGSASCLPQALRRPSSRNSLPRESGQCFPCFFLLFYSSTAWSVPAPLRGDERLGDPPSVSDPGQGLDLEEL